MTTVQIEWPDALVIQARTAELLASDAVHRLLSHAVQQQAANTPAISALDSAGGLVGCFNDSNSHFDFLNRSQSRSSASKAPNMG